MLFGIGRSIRKMLFFFVFLLAATVFLKQNCPQLGAQVGAWISGTMESPVVQALSSLMDSLSEGNSVKTAVEVFCENLEISS